MAIGLLQKLRLAFNGWARRREEAQKEFLQKNAGWVVPASVPLAPQGGERGEGLSIDREGLQVAFLDDSGRIVYYLDMESGEVVEARDGEKLAEPRYRRVPRRSAASDAADQREFVTTLEPSSMRDALRAARDPGEFRKALAQDRKIERAWYVFKNDRATAAIESWLRSISAG